MKRGKESEAKDYKRREEKEREINDNDEGIKLEKGWGKKRRER